MLPSHSASLCCFFYRPLRVILIDQIHDDLTMSAIQTSITKSAIHVRRSMYEYYFEVDVSNSFT